MKRRTRYVLIIDDNIHHAELMTEVLDRHFQPIVVHAVDDLRGVIDMLRSTSYDLIVSDSVVGNEQILDHLNMIIGVSGRTPMVIITGRGDERVAAELSKKGVVDYHVKTKETLEKLPDILAKHLHRRASSGKKRREVIVPTKLQLLEEIDKLTQDALYIAGQCMRRTAPRQDHVERVLESVSRLKKMVEKL